MKRVSVAATTAFVIAGCGTTIPARVPEPAPLSDAVEPQAVLRAMTTVADWQLANPSAHKPYEWQGAPFWAGLYELAERSSSRQKYLDAIRRNGESVQWQPGPQPFLADDHAVTQSYFLLYRVEHDRRVIEPALARFGEMLQAPFAESLEFSDDKTLREWVWCDALFMSPPALAFATSATGDGRYADLMDRLWWKTTDYLYDKQERLFYRDSRFFDQRERNNKKVFWSRGNGWVLAGLARVLQYLPPDHAGRGRFVALFQEMAQRIGDLQGPDGYWRASLLDPHSWPNPETSGTAFFTYALAWGMNEGLIGREYERAVRRGWSALVRAVQPSGKLGYVQRVGDAPGDTGPEQTEMYGTGGGRDFGAEWTPDGRELIYSSEHPSFDLYRRAADASRPAEPLLTGGFDHYPGAVSPDGRLFAFSLAVPGAGELWTVRLRGPPAATRYFANGFNLAHPTLSPDGRWMAYDSDESGRVEVYAQSYPNPSLKRWKVSPANGSEPMWTRGGRELVYRKGDSMMTVSVDLQNGRSSAPRALFGGPYPDSPGWTRPRSYDVSRDGERFLLTKLPAEQSRPRINVVLNWFAELRSKVPR